MFDWFALTVLLVIASVQTQRAFRSDDEDSRLYFRCWLWVLTTLTIYVIVSVADLAALSELL